MFFPPNGNYNSNGTKSANNSNNSLPYGNLTSNINKYQNSSQNLGYRGSGVVDSITPTMIRQSRNNISNSSIGNNNQSLTNNVIPDMSNNNGNNFSSGDFQKWSSMIDNCLIEFLSALFVNLTTVMCWDWSGDNNSLQYIPALVLGLVLLCLKDEDYFFPDASPTVTLVIWAIGGYQTWTQPCSRLFGQCIGLALSVWICSAATLPHVIIHVQHPLIIIFALEVIGTMLEHMAVVYVIMPLLPPENSHGANFKFPKVKPKSHHETLAPSNQSVLHAAFTFTSVHFCLWRAFNVEMNPSVTILIAYIRQLQLDNGNSNYAISGQNISSNAISRSLLSTTTNNNNPSLDISPWTHGLIALWGQCIGILLCIIYVVLYIPRENKYWPIVKRSSLY